MLAKLFPNSRLQYLDAILKELADSLGDYVSEDDIAPKVSFEDYQTPIGDIKITVAGIPVNKERVVFRSAMAYLEKQGLIFVQVKNPLLPDYMITFEGLVLVKNGGLLKQRNDEKYKDWLQKGFWILAFFTFLVNAYYLRENYKIKASERTTQAIQVVKE